MTVTSTTSSFLITPEVVRRLDDRCVRVIVKFEGDAEHKPNKTAIFKA